jgi:hypothetical protein
MLRDLQRAFAEALISGKPDAAPAIVAGTLTPPRRVEIYRHNVFTNLRGALGDIYPVVKRVVGEAFFQHAADQFIRATPSTSGDLNRFGREWPAFLAGYEPARELPYLPDVARLEWAWHEAFHAAEHAALDLARLAEVPAEDYAALRFTVHPALRLLDSPFPVLRVWQVNQPDYAGEMAVDWDQGPAWLRVRREGTEVLIESVAAAGYRFLAAVVAGEALEVAADCALAEDSEFDLQGFLVASVQCGILVNFRTEKP